MQHEFLFFLFSKYKKETKKQAAYVVQFYERLLFGYLKCIFIFLGFFWVCIDICIDFYFSTLIIDRSYEGDVAANVTFHAIIVNIFQIPWFFHSNILTGKNTELFFITCENCRDLISLPNTKYEIDFEAWRLHSFYGEELLCKSYFNSRKAVLRQQKGREMYKSLR